MRFAERPYPGREGTGEGVVLDPWLAIGVLPKVRNPDLVNV